MAFLFELLRIMRHLSRNDALYVLDRLAFPRSILRIVKFLYPPKPKPNNDKTQSLPAALLALGPTYIKLGQAFSIRPDLVGARLANQLRETQDAMPAFGEEEVKSTVETALGQPLSKLYRRFDLTASSAASIAQVHRAQTLSGDEVAVKVLRPDIHAQFERDIRNLRRTISFIARFRPQLQRFQPGRAVDNFAAWSRKELDLRQEAASCSELRRRFKDYDWFSPPKIYWELTSRDVLTQEWITGNRIDDVTAMRRNGLDPKRILQRSVEAFFIQVFHHGFFHADIHPGNIFVTDKGILRPVDFGIMGRMSKQMRHVLADMLLGLMTRDYEQVVDAHIRAGIISPLQATDSFADALRGIIEPTVNQSLAGISFANIFKEIITLARQFDLQFNPDLLLLNKAMLQAEGTGRQIDSNINVWRLTEPLMEDWLLQNRGINSKLQQLVTVGGKLLQQIDQVLAANPGTGFDARRSGLSGQQQVPKKKASKWVANLLWLFCGMCLGAIALVAIWLASQN